MSVQNFGYVKDKKALPKRRDSDLYPTERSLIESVMDAWRVDWKRAARYGKCMPPTWIETILDPSCGNDARWGIETKKGLAPSADVYAVEFRDISRPEGLHGFHGGTDFRDFHETMTAGYKSPIGKGFSIIATNPPYSEKVPNPKTGKEKIVSLIDPFLSLSWDLLAPGGIIMFLARRSWAAGVGRHNGLFKRIPIYFEYTHARRPRFYGKSTNTIDYSTFVFLKGLDGKPSRFYANDPGFWGGRSILHERDDSLEQGVQPGSREVSQPPKRRKQLGLWDAQES